ncbi:MAG: phosphoribosylformimino-5-aminoimidazole carboxamide ribotide isomerase [Firmicutes bacterium]|nr:phosphoribosylformimino-5-aminoimidazole carboxamide ribotide isomerase [Bacillota bacterium]
MIIFPAIDIKDGQAVRLYKGEFSKKEVVSTDIIQTAKGFQDDGAEFLHMVDLDGALKGESGNLRTISEILKNIDIPVQLGGGIRSLDTIDKLLGIGINRVILGTSALNNKELVVEAVKKYGKRIVVGIDANNRKVAVEGWIKVSDVDYIEFAKTMEQIGVGTIIFTDISRDGTLTGPNLEQLEEINSSVGCDIIASGGIKDVNDIVNIRNLGVYGAITGKAIYSGYLDLKEAIKAGKEA